MYTIDDFKLGRIPVPMPINSDAYTVSSDCLVSEQAKKLSVYQVLNRRGPSDVPSLKSFCKTPVMVSYGLTDYIRNHLTKKMTHSDVDDAGIFMSTAHSFGGPLKFNPEIWHDAISQFGGYMPIRIQSLPEGSAFLPGEPIIQVSAFDGFGEMAAHIEPILLGMWSNTTARLTITKHWYEHIKGLVAKNKGVDNEEVIESVARWMIHDFGMRASSTAEESEIYGRAHLLVFNGTDTFNAAYQARVLGAKTPIGTSILALAHRIVQGYELEYDCFRNLAQQDWIASYLPDCYNFENAVRKHIKKLMVEFTKNTFIIRSDSGIWLENLDEINNLRATFGRRTRYLNGDSINPSTVIETDEHLSEERWTKPEDYMSEWGGFGCGGFLRNTPNRDLFSSKYALSAIDGNSVIKFSDSLSKQTIPGPNRLTRCEGPTIRMDSEDCGSEYVTYYNGTLNEPFLAQCVEDFMVTRKRVEDEFYSLDHKIGSELRSPKVLEEVEILRRKYLGY